jgi:hypothetical protein
MIKNITTSRGYVEIVSIIDTNDLQGFDNLVRLRLSNGKTVVKTRKELDFLKSVYGLYMYFDVGTVIDSEFLSKNNLFRKSSKNKDCSKVGFVQTCVVKSRKFGDVISNGLLLPLNHLLNYDIFYDFGIMFDGKKFNRVDIETGKFYKASCRARNGKNKRGGKNPEKYFHKNIQLFLTKQERN